MGVCLASTVSVATFVNHALSVWFGVFVATINMFFLAETGDKTQVATVVLAARLTDTFWVLIRTTTGMLIANIPVIMAGRW